MWPRIKTLLSAPCVKNNTPYPLRKAPDAVQSPGAMGISLLKRWGYPETSVLGSGYAYYVPAGEPVTEGLLATAPIGAPVTLGEVTLDTFGVDPAIIGPWAG